MVGAWVTSAGAYLDVVATSGGDMLMFLCCCCIPLTFGGDEGGRPLASDGKGGCGLSVIAASGLLVRGANA